MILHSFTYPLPNEGISLSYISLAPLVMISGKPGRTNTSVNKHLRYRCSTKVLDLKLDLSPSLEPNDVFKPLLQILIVYKKFE